MNGKRLASSSKRDAQTTIEYINELHNTGSIPFLTPDAVTQLCAAVQGHRDTECIQFRKTYKHKKPAGSPKNALNPYIFFAKDDAVRKSIITATPGISPKEVTRKLGELWKEMTDDAKAKYVQQSIDDKTRYQEELSVYQESSMASTSAAAAPEVAEAPAAAAAAPAAPAKSRRTKKASA